MQDLESSLSDEADACLSLGLPATICHKIDETSPLFDLSIETMARRRMEVPSRLMRWLARGFCAS